MTTTPGSPTSPHGCQGLLSPVLGGQSHSAVRRALLAHADVPVAPQGPQYSGACNVIRGCTQSQSTSQTDNWKRSIVSWLAGTGKLWKRIFWGILTRKKGCFPVEGKDTGEGGSSEQREHSFQHSSPGVVQVVFVHLPGVRHLVLRVWAFCLRRGRKQVLPEEIWLQPRSATHL